ncbi:hypothetical protein HKCCE3408_00965 [Rhodobacterales bacterium HKCCE3408]|nr:hypothetical protein [Rhodobacterales bacterium HKCCE3408]
MLRRAIDELSWYFSASPFARMMETQFGEARFIIFAAVFVGVFLAFEGIRNLLARAENRSEAINRRMKMQAKGKSDEEILGLIKARPRRGFWSNVPLFGDMNAALHSARITAPPEFVALACVLTFVAFGVVSSNVVAPMLAFAISACMFLLLPLLVLKTVHLQRMQNLVRQLPDALDLMARGLKVGHPLNTTLRSVADEMPDPIGTEFGTVVDQVAYGDELTVAMSELADRLNQEDMHYLAIAINMQAGTGGDLARVLRILGSVIRSRITLRRKIRAISSEGRLTAYILSALPVAIAAFMTISNPTYFGDVMHYPEFWPVMGMIAGAIVLNALILFRLVRFRI